MSVGLILVLKIVHKAAPCFKYLYIHLEVFRGTSIFLESYHLLLFSSLLLYTLLYRSGIYSICAYKHIYLASTRFYDDWYVLIGPT